MPGGNIPFSASNHTGDLAALRTGRFLTCLTVDVMMMMMVMLMFMTVTMMIHRLTGSANKIKLK